LANGACPQGWFSIKRRKKLTGMDRIDRIKKDEGKNVSLFILTILSILFDSCFKMLARRTLYTIYLC
jgi:hypothetical protein